MATDHLSLWQEVKRLQGKEPYCYSSELFGHKDAAEQVAKDHGLVGDELKAWNAFVREKTARMSNYTGD